MFTFDTISCYFSYLPPFLDLPCRLSLTRLPSPEPAEPSKPSHRQNSSGKFEVVLKQVIPPHQRCSSQGPEKLYVQPIVPQGIWITLYIVLASRRTGKYTNYCIYNSVCFSQRVDASVQPLQRPVNSPRSLMLALDFKVQAEFAIAVTLPHFIGKQELSAQRLRRKTNGKKTNPERISWIQRLFSVSNCRRGPREKDPRHRHCQSQSEIWSQLRDTATTLRSTGYRSVNSVNAFHLEKDGWDALKLGRSTLLRMQTIACRWPEQGLSN